MNKLLRTAEPLIMKDHMVDQAPGRVKCETPSQRPNLNQTRSFQVVSHMSPSLAVHNSHQTHCNNYLYSAITTMLGVSPQLDVKFLDSEALICKPIKSTI